MSDEHPIAAGCLGWFLIVALVVVIAWTIVGAMTSDDPPGRCAYEPGPNGITISYCEPEN